MGFKSEDAQEEARQWLLNSGLENENLSGDDVEEMLRNNEKFQKYILEQVFHDIDWDYVSKATWEQDVVTEGDMERFARINRLQDEYDVDQYYDEYPQFEEDDVEWLYIFPKSSAFIYSHPAIAFAKHGASWKKLYKMVWVSPTLEQKWKDFQNE